MKLYDRVLILLDNNPEFRDSDKKLAWKVWQLTGSIKEGRLDYAGFLSGVSFESIGRARRKVQELHPELKGSAATRREEKALEKGTFIFRETINTQEELL